MTNTHLIWKATGYDPKPQGAIAITSKKQDVQPYFSVSTKSLSLFQEKKFALELSCLEERNNIEVWFQVISNLLVGIMPDSKEIQKEDEIKQTKNIQIEPNDVTVDYHSPLTSLNCFAGTYFGQRVSVSEFSVAVDEQKRSEALQEIYILSQLKHTNIVALFGFFATGSLITVVSEYSPFTLSQYLFHPEKIVIDPVDFGRQITSGMHFLASKDIIHRYLRPSSILIEMYSASESDSLKVGERPLRQIFRFKIADFGLSLLKKKENGANH